MGFSLLEISWKVKQQFLSVLMNYPFWFTIKIASHEVGI